MLAAVFKRKDVLEIEDRPEPKNLAGAMNSRKQLLLG